MNGDTAFPFACPWCGSRFAARAGEDSLAAHWIESPDCFRNRNVSSQLRKPSPDIEVLEGGGGEGLHLVEDDEEGV